MFDAEWLLPDGSQAPLYNVDRLIIAVATIVMVEIMKRTDEITANTAAIAEIQELLVRANKGEPDGESSSTTAPDA